jgi:hypothetical protein
MKRLLNQACPTLLAMFWLVGCVAVVKDQPAGSKAPTAGQQLVDLKHAKDVGAISDAEYETQKAKILGKQ